MGAPWKTTEKKRREIVEFYRLGIPIHHIAHVYGIHEGYVSYLARKYGLPRRTKHSKVWHNPSRERHRASA